MQQLLLFLLFYQQNKWLKFVAKSIYLLFFYLKHVVRYLSSELAWYLQYKKLL